MNAIVSFISNNPLISGLLVLLVGAVFTWAAKFWRDRQDTKSIYEFLVSSAESTGFTFRSTEAISSHTKVPAERVEELCLRHPRIRRNEKEKESWTLL